MASEHPMAISQVNEAHFLREEIAHLREVNAALVEALKLFLVDWSGDQSPPRKVLIARAALAAAEPRGEGGRG